MVIPSGIRTPPPNERSSADDVDRAEDRFTNRPLHAGTQNILSYSYSAPSRIFSALSLGWFNWMEAVSRLSSSCSGSNANPSLNMVGGEKSWNVVTVTPAPVRYKEPAGLTLSPKLETAKGAGQCNCHIVIRADIDHHGIGMQFSDGLADIPRCDTETELVGHLPGIRGTNSDIAVAEVVPGSGGTILHRDLHRVGVERDERESDEIVSAE